VLLKPFSALDVLFRSGEGWAEAALQGLALRLRNAVGGGAFCAQTLNSIIGLIGMRGVDRVSERMLALL